jgi:hypothetical protein
MVLTTGAGRDKVLENRVAVLEIESQKEKNVLLMLML